jgi:transcriptional regulator GlxA family with amidase domain
MKHVSILVPKGQFSIVNIAGSFQILNWASDTYFQQTRQPLFTVEFVGYSKPAADSDGWYTVSPPRTVADIAHTDLIILPAVHSDMPAAVQENQEIIGWIQRQYAAGAGVAAFCIGVYLLAETGILNGKSCSTHWAQAENLQKAYPEIKVQSEKIVTECNGIYTSGGAYAFTNLLLYLIEKYGGRELAILTAKAFMLDIDKNNQAVFMIFQGQKDHGDELVQKVQEYLESNYTEKVGVAELADRFAITRRTLERRFKAATGNSALEYLQRIRIEAAKRQLEGSQATVNTAMYEVGYSDTKAFREVFKKYAGLSPAEYKKKFKNVLAEA